MLIFVNLSIPAGHHSGHHHYHYTNLIPSRSSSASNHGNVIPPYSDFLEIPETIFAQQLTRMDHVSWELHCDHLCLCINCTN